MRVVSLLNSGADIMTKVCNESTEVLNRLIMLD